VAETIQRIFIDPPIAVARLGGSNAPQDAFEWEVPSLGKGVPLKDFALRDMVRYALGQGDALGKGAP